MKVKRMGKTEILRRIWVFSTNKIKSSESGSKQPTQHIVELNSSLRYIIITKECFYFAFRFRIFQGIHYSSNKITKTKAQ